MGALQIYLSYTLNNELLPAGSRTAHKQNILISLHGRAQPTRKSSWFCQNQNTLCVRTIQCSLTNTHTHAQTYIYTYTYTYTHTHPHKLTHKHTQAHYTYVHTYIQTYNILFHAVNNNHHMRTHAHTCALWWLLSTQPKKSPRT